MTHALLACHRAHRAQMAALLGPHGLQPGQDILLATIWAEPGLRQAVLAQRIGVEPPTVSRMLARLERRGLISRLRDPHDARLWRIHPTPRSRLLEASVLRSWIALEESIEAALGGAGATQLVRLLAKATEAVERVDD